MVKETTTPATPAPVDTDDRNPAYLFQSTSADLLMQIARGDINPVERAKQELANRGLDIRTGKWVGFNKAFETAKLHAVRNGKGGVQWISVPE